MPTCSKVTPVRVLLVGLPRMLTDIVAEFAGTHDDIAITELSEPSATLLDGVDFARADVLICPRERREECRHLLWARPRLKIISLSGEGREAELHELRPQERLLGNLAPERLLAVIRSARMRPAEDAG